MSEQNGANETTDWGEARNCVTNEGRAGRNCVRQMSLFSGVLVDYDSAPCAFKYLFLSLPSGFIAEIQQSCYNRHFTNGLCL